MFGTRSRVRALKLSGQASEQPQEPPAQERAEPPAQERAESPAQEPAESPTQERAESPTQERAEPPAQERAESPAQEPAESPTQERAESPTQERAEPPAQERTDPVDEQQDLNLREAGQDITVADKPPQRLYSLYENLHSTSPALRQSSHGQRLLNWLQSIKPYRLRRCRSDTNIQLLPEFYTNSPPMSALKDSTVAPQDQDTFCHSARPSRLDGLAGTSKGQLSPVDRADYRDILEGKGIYMLNAEAEVPSSIQSVIDFIKSGIDQPLDKAKPASSSYSTGCENKAIHGVNEEEVRRFFNDYLFSEACLSANFRRNGTIMKKYCVPTVKVWEAKISTPHPDLLFGYSGNRFPQQQKSYIHNWDPNVAKFSFLSVDYKGDGSISNGKLWAATNQCLVATATCVRIMKELRDDAKELGDGKMADSLDFHVFGLVSNGTEARLFVTFEDAEGDIHMKLISGFLLYDSQHRANLEGCIEKVFKWAEERKGRIEAAVDSILSKSLMATNKRGHDDGSGGPVTKRPRGASAATVTTVPRSF